MKVLREMRNGWSGVGFGGSELDIRVDAGLTFGSVDDRVGGRVDFEGARGVRWRVMCY